MKIRPVGAELSHTNGRMDGPANIRKLIVAFRNFTNPPKNELLFIYMRNFLVK